MGSKRSTFVEDYPRLCALGFGQGRFNEYRPFLMVYGASTCSCKYRVYSSRLGRFLHLLSHGELNMFFQCEWNDNVIEIREQFPLDPDVTQQISRELGCRHPAVRGKPVVMTTDFLITVQRGSGCREYKAFQIKHQQQDLDNARTHEKLVIEKLFWQRKGIPWEVVLSSCFNSVLCGNLEQLHPYRNKFLSPEILWNLHDGFCWLLEMPGLEFGRCSRYERDVPGLGRTNAADAVRILTAYKLWKFDRITEDCIQDSVMGSYSMKVQP